jgi:hypothetical protein
VNINLNIELPPMDKNDLAKVRSSLTAFAKQIAATRGIPVGQHKHHMFRIKTKDDYLIELRQAFELSEIDEIYRLCEECARVTREGLEYYADTVVMEVELGFSKDYVRYALYQTCMVNRSDDMKTDTHEEQFFK